MERPEIRPVRYSQTTITELMIPAYANFGGKIHGGFILSLMDKIAYACAAKHSGGYCVTVSVDRVDFRAPVEVGELVSLLGSVNYVGNSSMVVGIRVEAENVKLGTTRHTNTSYFTMVAKDEQAQPTRVPRLCLESRDQVRRYLEAIKRIELRNRFQTELDDEKSQLNIETELHLLEGHRCEIAAGVFP
ncbi:MAG: acyl-CoA thioesterase [Bacteroidota bacterium]